MASNSRRPLFYTMVLAIGFILGGFMNVLLRRFLPDSPTKAFFTYAVTPELGPVPVNLLVIHFTIGPVGLDVSLLSILGVVVAYLVARSLF